MDADQEKGSFWGFFFIVNLHLKKSDGFLCESKIHRLKLALGLNGGNRTFPVVVLQLFSDCSYCKL